MSVFYIGLVIGFVSGGSLGAMAMAVVTIGAIADRRDGIGRSD